ncbi:hypothetical protein BH10PAT1_BH10PAT1_4990 [soil metagenome]
MKKLLAIIPIITLAIFVFLVSKNQTTTPNKSDAESITETPTPQNNNSIKINDFTFSWFEVNTDNLKLIPNFSEKLSSREFLTNNKCQFLSNGPFYSKDSQPLALFITDGNTLHDFQTNALFNGILSINDFSTPRITKNIPSDHLNIAIQTGPILKENNSYETLKIIDDTESRRVVAAVTGENKLFFLVIYKSNSEYFGPLLADLPNQLKNFEDKTGIVFADAINLDGGSASTFTSPSVHLSEISSVGAFFCQL